MNILLINKFYFEKGGAERYFFGLKKLLEKNGHRVIPFSTYSQKNFKTAYEKYFVSAIKTQPSWNIWQNFKTVFRFWWSLEARKKIKKLLTDEKIDLVHLQNIYHQISPSILPIFKKRKIPVVMTVHDYSLICPNYNLFFKGREYARACGNKYYQCLFDRCVNTNFVQSLVSVIEMYLHHKILNVYQKNIDLFIAPSRFVANKLINAGFDSRQIVILPHFTEIPKRLSAEPLQGFKKDYILYFGRLSEEKGVATLIKAMKSLPQIKLKIVGQGAEEKNYQLLIANYQLQNIELLGHQSAEELKKIILGAKFVIVPSLSPETFGLSVLESFALGKCVLASKIGALPELVNEKFLFKPGDAQDLVNKIKFLWNNNKILIRAGEQVQQFVKQNNNAQGYYKKIIGLYKSLK